jgi:hypothetical protein
MNLMHVKNPQAGRLAHHLLTRAASTCPCRRLTGNPGLACPAIDGGTNLWLSKLDYACDTSPYINLDAWVQRQRLADGGAAAAALDSGLDIKSWANIGTSAATWAGTVTIQPATPAGRVKAVGALPAVSGMHATLASPQTIQWAPAGSTGATFCVVAKLPATTAANSNQVLFDFSPAFTMARDGLKGDMAVLVGATKVLAPAVFDGKWHCYVAVTDGKTTTLYVDGVKKGAGAHAAVTAASSQATAHLFGAPSKVQTSMLAGDVRQVMAWRRPLAAAELAALQAQLKAKWKL